MSFRPPKARKPHRQSSPPSVLASHPTSRSTSPSKALSATHQLVPPSAVSQGRQPRNSQNMFISRQAVLVSVPGHNFSQMSLPDRGRMPRVASYTDPPSRSTADSHPEAAEYASDEIPAFDMDNVFITPGTNNEDVNKARKREAQWNRWMNEVIPSLLRPHLALLRQSASLRSISRSDPVNCTCGKTGTRHLKVVLVHFESKFSSGLWACRQLEFDFASLQLQFHILDFASEM